MGKVVSVAYIGGSLKLPPVHVCTCTEYYYDDSLSKM